MALGSSRIVRYIITGDSAGAVKAMKETEVAASKVGSKLEETGGKMKSLGSGMSSFGRKLSYLSVPLLAVGGYSIKAAMDFQTSMTQLRTQAGASAKELKYLEGAVLGMGNTGFAANELSEALYPIRSDGFKGAEGLKVLKAAAAGAQVSGAGLTQTASGLTSVLRTNLRDVHGAAGAMNQLNSIVGLGKLKWEDLNGALSTGFLSTVHKTGLGLNDIGTALDAFARKGIPAEQAATNFRKTLIQFDAIVGGSKKNLAKIGVSQFELAKDLKKPHGLIVALQDLHNHLGKVGELEGNAILAQAFGRSKGAGTIYGLLETLGEQKKIEGERGNSGSLSQALKLREANATNKVAKAVANLKDSLILLGKTLVPVVLPALTKFSKLIIGGIEWLKKMPKPVKDVMVGFAILLAVGGPLLIFFGHMISAMGSVIGVAGKLATALSTRLGPAVESAVADAAEASSAETAAFAGLGGILGAALAGGIVAYMATSSGPKWFRKLFDLSGHHTILHEAFAANPLDYWATPSAGFTEKRERRALKSYAKDKHITQSWQQRGFHSAAEARAVDRQAAQQQHSETIQIHSHIHLDGKEVARSTATHTRNDPTVARPMAEGITKYAQNRAARE